MGADTGIAWANDTFNPWWGCSRVSPGCEHCYAEFLAVTRRKLPVWGVDAERKAMSEDHWKLLPKWNRQAEASRTRRRVFCASMADVFEKVPPRNVQGTHVMSQGRARLWQMIRACGWLDFLLLTKRIENAVELTPWGDRDSWPPNVWLGVTVEDNLRRGRIEMLRKIPAQRKFVSYEPALEDVNFDGWLEGIHWLIIGGESGNKARPFDLQWARRAIASANAQGVTPFMKQLGENVHDSALSIVGGWMPGDPEPVTRIRVKAKKGDDPAEWEEGLRVQRWPSSPAANTDNWYGHGV